MAYELFIALSSHLIRAPCCAAAAPAALVREPAEEPAADRSHEEAGGEYAGGVQELGGLVALRKELGGEVERGERVDVEVVPLDEIAGGTGNDRAHAPQRVMAIVVYRSLIMGEGGHAAGEAISRPEKW